MEAFPVELAASSSPFKQSRTGCKRFVKAIGGVVCMKSSEANQTCLEIQSGKSSVLRCQQLDGSERSPTIGPQMALRRHSFKLPEWREAFDSVAWVVITNAAISSGASARS